MAVTVEHSKRVNLDLERSLLKQKLSGTSVLGHVQFGRNGTSMMVEPADGDPYIYEKGGFYTTFRRDGASSWDKLRAKHECQRLFDQLNNPGQVFSE